MFTKEIEQTPFATSIADRVLGVVKNCDFSNDRSMTSTLRALLARRIDTKNNTLHVYKFSNAYSYEALRGSPDNAVFSAVVPSDITQKSTQNFFFVGGYNSDDKANEEVFRIFDQGFLSYTKDIAINSGCSEEEATFSELEDLKTFFAQKHIRARFYINEARKGCYILIENLDIKKWHLLQSLIPRYFPWWFAEKPLNDKEKELLRSLTNRYAPAYEAAITAIAQDFDMRSMIIKESLEGFEAQFEQQYLDEVRHSIATLQRDIDDIILRWSELAVAMHAKKEVELGLELKIANGGDVQSELMEYFLTNKNLHLQSKNGGRIDFVVTGYLDNFDPDQFDRMIENEDSYLYQYAGEYFTERQIRCLLTEIFSTERIKMRVCAAYQLDFTQMRYRGLDGYGFGSEFSSFLPNMHIQLYHCLGGNEPYIRDAVCNHDYVLAVANCAASAGNINFGDYTVGSRFMRALFYDDDRNKKFLELPDGSIVSPTEAIAWLDEENQTTE